MSGRYLACLVVAVALTAGCSATAQLTDQPARNATLSLAGYEHVEEASPVETRVFWDRSKSWEDPGKRNVTVTSRAHAYRSPNGTAVVVYTTPKKPYVGSDRIRSLSAPGLADRATRAVSVRSPGRDGGGTSRAPLLDRTVTVWALTDGAGRTVGHVTRVARSGVIVVVVVAGDVKHSTVSRVLGGVTLKRDPASA